jgi:hypothetical protein
MGVELRLSMTYRCRCCEGAWFNTEARAGAGVSDGSRTGTGINGNGSSALRNDSWSWSDCRGSEDGGS